LSEIILSNIQIWRQKSRDGTMTLEDTRAAIAAIRKERTQAGTISAASKERKSTAKAKAAPIDSNALLGQLGL
jgi:hypothetical protein